MRASVSILLLGIVAVACGGCIVPVAHTRVHAFGVTGQVVSATSDDAVVGASVTSIEQPQDQAHCDRSGRFRLPPKRGWHAAYCIGPICESLLPSWDVTYPRRFIHVSAPGYAAADFAVGIAGTNEVTGKLDGAYLKVAQLKLYPLGDPSANKPMQPTPR